MTHPLTLIPSYVDFQENLRMRMHAICGEDNGEKFNHHLSGPGSLFEPHLSSVTLRNSI